MDNLSSFGNIITFVVGFVFIIAGIVMYIFPPKSINGWYGYRTSGSMSSQARWDFAQKYSAKLMIIGGVILIGVGILLSQLGFSNPNIGTFLSIVLGIVLIYLTERKLKKILD